MEQLGFSKINMGLAILNKRDDGYHNIDTVFQSIRLGDSVYFAHHHSVVFSGAAPELPAYMQALIPYDEENLAYKAIRLLQDYTGCQQGAAIHLLKRVPVQAGLGGGSADAAAMLKGLNKFWDLRLTMDELLQLGLQLGSDVPFLLQGGTARGTSRGEILDFVSSPTAHWLLIVKPTTSIETGPAYHRFSKLDTTFNPASSTTIDTVLDCIAHNDMKGAFTNSYNTFEPLIFPTHPELTKVKQFFTSRGYPTLMTGSGPTMVVLLERATDALSLQEEVKRAGHDWLTLITKTCTQEEVQ